MSEIVIGYIEIPCPGCGATMQVKLPPLHSAAPALLEALEARPATGYKEMDDEKLYYEVAVGLEPWRARWELQVRAAIADAKGGTA